MIHKGDKKLTAQLVLHDIFTIFVSYWAKNFIIAILNSVIILFVINLIQKKRQKKHRNIFFQIGIPMFFFLLYVCYVLEITLLCREPGSRVGMDLQLFGTIHIDDPYAMSFVVENLLLFFPFGILFSWLFCPIYCPAAAFLFSVGIEVTQLKTGRGYFQIDDIWLNFLGASLGVLCFCVIRVILKFIMCKSKENVL